MKDRLQNAISKMKDVLARVDPLTNNDPPVANEDCKCNPKDGRITAWQGRCVVAVRNDGGTPSDAWLKTTVLSDNCKNVTDCKSGSCVYNVECKNRRKPSKTYFTKKIQTVNGCAKK